MAWENTNNISKTPLLMIQGKEDTVCKPENAIKFFDKLDTKNKEMILLEGNNKSFIE